jgi:biotin synthase-related radical SAM superfamily protein
MVFRHPQQVARTIEIIEENPDLRSGFNIEDKYNPDLTDKEIIKRKLFVEPQDININAGALKNAARIYGNTIAEIRKVSQLPIFIEIGPLGREEIEDLHYTGTDAVSFNLEVYDQKMRKEVIPGKARRNSLDDYLKSMANAVDVFGENQVNSWILIGLEPPEKTIEGIRKIAETGAIPLPKPFRPLYGADYENKKPPQLEDAILIYEEWFDAIRECGLNPLKAKAGCARCNACFPLKELLKYGI